MEFLCDLLEVVFVSISFFMIKKYIFLENDLSKKSQSIFYVITAIVTAAMFFVFGKLIAEGVCALAVIVNVVLARRKHILSGIVMVFALFLVNGIMVPLMVVPPYLIALPANIWQLAVYGVLAAGFLSFVFLGREWRERFAVNTMDRSLSITERIMLIFGGVISGAFSMRISRTIGDGTVTELEFKELVAISSIFAITLIAAFLVMVMQGNKRNYYLRKYTDMQTHMITTMADIIENRDESTGGHIRRTAKYVEILAKELQHQGKFADVLTNRYISDMVMAAPLHDIGKIHIPDAVLNKPGRLTEDEFALMKTHTTAGKELLQKAMGDLGEIHYLNIAIEMAAYHHEWNNGNGYPYGASDADIPLCAKILAVADVFDALTSRRVYKDPMPFEKACSIIREERGTHFDSDVVDAFIVSCEKIRAALNSFEAE